MIIGIAGKLQSGKSTLARYLVDTKGFKQISFARKLKELTADLYDWDITQLYTSWKDQPLETPVAFGQKERNKLAKMIGAKNPITPVDYVFKSGREALQFLGTEVIRDYNKNFHIEHLASTLGDTRYNHYVCDDLRFTNEFEFLKSKDAKLIYVASEQEKASDHVSENTLTEDMFTYTILNHQSINDLIRRFDRIFDQSCVAQFNKNNTSLDLRYSDYWDGAPVARTDNEKKLDRECAKLQR